MIADRDKKQQQQHPHTHTAYELSDTNTSIVHIFASKICEWERYLIYS